jgi:O-antigen/teichoic acid export membrane protein
LSTFCALGFQRTLLRFTSIYHAKDDWGRLRGLVEYAEKRITITGLTVLIIGYLLLWLIKDRLDTHLYLTFLVGLFVIPITAITEARAWTLRGLGYVVMAIFPLGVVRPLVLLTAIGIFYLFKFDLKPVSAMFTGMVSILFCLTIISIFVKRNFVPAKKVYPNTDAIPEWRRSAFTLFIIGCLQAFSNQIGVFALGWFSTSSDVGVYAIAFRIADLTQFPLIAINVVFAPTIARLFEQNNKVELQSMVTTTAQWAAFAAISISLPLFIFPEFFLSFFGIDFIVGANTLRIILIGQTIQAIGGSLNNLIVMTGHESGAAKLLGVAIVINMILSVILIPLFGIEGAGLARCVAISSWTIFAIFFARQKLGIVPSVLGARLR